MKKRSCSLRMEKDLAEWVDEQATRKKRTWSRTLIMILEAERRRDMARQKSLAPTAKEEESTVTRA